MESQGLFSTMSTTPVDPGGEDVVASNEEVMNEEPVHIRDIYSTKMPGQGGW